MKLNPEELVVSSFETADVTAAEEGAVTTRPEEPTPATYCVYCPRTDPLTVEIGVE